MTSVARLGRLLLELADQRTTAKGAGDVGAASGIGLVTPHHHDGSRLTGVNQWA